MLEISPDKVSNFALLLESTKAMIENVRAEMHRKKIYQQRQWQRQRHRRHLQVSRRRSCLLV
jgi:hypothetical protein